MDISFLQTVPRQARRHRTLREICPLLHVLTTIASDPALDDSFKRVKHLHRRNLSLEFAEYLPLTSTYSVSPESRSTVEHLYYSTFFFFVPPLQSTLHALLQPIHPNLTLSPLHEKSCKKKISIFRRYSLWQHRPDSTTFRGHDIPTYLNDSALRREVYMGTAQKHEPPLVIDAHRSPSRSRPRPTLLLYVMNDTWSPHELVLPHSTPPPLRLLPPRRPHCHPALGIRIHTITSILECWRNPHVRQGGNERSLPSTAC